MAVTFLNLHNVSLSIEGEKLIIETKENAYTNMSVHFSPMGGHATISVELENYDVEDIIELAKLREEYKRLQRENKEIQAELARKEKQIQKMERQIEELKGKTKQQQEYLSQI